jgi:hypothetical protein
MSRNWSGFLVSLLLALTCGCSTFERRWKAAPAQLAPDTLSGRWDGSWLSDVNQHTGRLRCVVGEDEGGRRKFDFWATYFKVIQVTYTVTLNATPVAPGVHRLSGSQDLGGFKGGVYTYEGTASNGVLRATYSSGFDHGMFRLRRVDR